MPTILIADDDPDQREIVRDLLTMAGYGVVEAADGPGAVAAAAAGRPDLILMDITMPGIDDGLIATRELRARPDTRHIPVVALSGQGMDYQRQRAVAAGCTDMVVKPFDFDHLLAVIAAHLPGAPK